MLLGYANLKSHIFEEYQLPPTIQHNREEIQGVLAINKPKHISLPFVFESPHSGRNYPTDFKTQCSEHSLKFQEDPYIDQIFAKVCSHGAVLLEALFPRNYIDVNRRQREVDPLVCREEDRASLDYIVTAKTRAGAGLIPHYGGEHGDEFINENLSSGDIEKRIRDYYIPYHNTLEKLIENTINQFGVCFHVSCHAMRGKGYAYTPDMGLDRSDFALGNQHGISCPDSILKIFSQAIEKKNYSVAANTPYSGYELLQRHAAPENNIYSIQIEVNRALYEDPNTLIIDFNKVSHLAIDIYEIINEIKMVLSHKYFPQKPSLLERIKKYIPER